MTNPGIKYEYTVRKDGLDNDVEKFLYFWQFGRWTECSVTCGTGEEQLLSLANPTIFRVGQRGDLSLWFPFFVCSSSDSHRCIPETPLSSDCEGCGLKEWAFCLHLIGLLLSHGYDSTAKGDWEI